MRSTSSMTKEWLLTKHQEGDVVDPESVYQALVAHYTDCDVSRSGVSSFFFKASTGEDPGLVLVERKSRLGIYSINSMDNLEKIPVAATARVSGHSGNSGPRKSRSVPPSKESIKERLCELAESMFQLSAELEAITAPLSSYSTKELLGELTKRAATKETPS